MNTSTPERIRIKLADARLFREQAYVDGQWCDADSDKVIRVTNPATGELIGTVPNMGAQETRRAIAAADAAMPAWRAQDREGARQRCCASGTT